MMETGVGFDLGGLCGGGGGHGMEQDYNHRCLPRPPMIRQKDMSLDPKESF